MSIDDKPEAQGQMLNLKYTRPPEKTYLCKFTLLKSESFFLWRKSESFFLCLKIKVVFCSKNQNRFYL